MTVEEGEPYLGAELRRLRRASSEPNIETGERRRTASELRHGARLITDFFPCLFGLPASTIRCGLLGRLTLETNDRMTRAVQIVGRALPPTLDRSVGRRTGSKSNSAKSMGLRVNHLFPYFALASVASRQTISRVGPGTD